MAIIDSDTAFARQVRRSFEAEGYAVEWFDGPARALAEVRVRTFDLLLVDGGSNGAELCRRLRSEALRREVPIIAMTTDPDVHPDALIAGADESVLKTLSMRELVARASAVVRRSAPALRETAAHSSPGLEIFPGTMRIIRDGRQVSLSKGESEVLALLIRHAPASLSVEHIRSELATISSPVSRSGIEARLKSLRRKIGHDRIVNRIGFGYSFAGPMTG